MGLPEWASGRAASPLAVSHTAPMSGSIEGQPSLALQSGGKGASHMGRKDSRQEVSPKPPHLPQCFTKSDSTAAPPALPRNSPWSCSPPRHGGWLIWLAWLRAAFHPDQPLPAWALAALASSTLCFYLLFWVLPAPNLLTETNILEHYTPRKRRPCVHHTGEFWEMGSSLYQ